jgi:molecular chaperone GrpE
MKPKIKPHNLEEADTDNTLSIDEFFKQLEAKEKDLDISSEMVIEFEDSDSIEDGIPDFIKADLQPSIEIETFSPKAAAPNDFAPNQVDVSKLQTEIQNLQNQLAQRDTERLEMFENARRRQSDFDNYKKRTERERSETFRNQLSTLATQMLPVVDNLNRALDLTNTIAEEKPQDFQQFFEGIVLVSQQLNEILAEMGVQPINAVGETFDPHFHEAVAAEADHEVPPNTVTMELQRGYRIGDKVIRPSMVKVSTVAATN